MYLSDNGDYMTDDDGNVIFDYRKKNYDPFKITKADYLFHDVMHDSITVDEAIERCPDAEKEKLIDLLAGVGKY